MKKYTAMILALLMLFACSATVFAAETTEASVPVVLTVVNTAKPISVTVPASMPVSVVDGYVVCANNAKITNNGERPIRVTALEVLDGAYKVGDYVNFTGTKDSIALSINGCPTKGAGAVVLTDAAFPNILGRESLPIQYKAKVAFSSPVTNISAATVIFTIGEATEGG